jgi:Mechanosensitive ion channel
MKKSMFSKYENSTDPEHAEYYLSYYRKIQSLDIFRAISILVVLSIIFTFKTGGSVNFLLVGLGALIIILKEFILSVIAFFIIIRRYRIGDTIGIGDIQGQIIYIRMLGVGILGKDNDGDNTGRMFVIPSYRFLTETIKKEDLHTDSIRKELLRIPFRTDDFTIDFATFIRALETFLDNELNTLSKKNCGNYQAYIGHRYKMDIDYLEDKCITITVGLVGSWEANVQNKKKIVSFVESRKKENTIPA